MSKLATCIWSDNDAEAQAAFYAGLLPDGRVTAVHRAPSDTPATKAGEVVLVEFELAGQPFMLLNGGPIFPHSEAMSIVIHTDDQAETDRLWDVIVGHGGQESACGWCKDRWGVNWQITPRRLVELAFRNPDPASARRAFEAMMTMTRIDIAAIERAAAAEEKEA